MYYDGRMTLQLGECFAPISVGHVQTLIL